MTRKVAVTGVGLLSPLGNNVATAWRAAINGDSGIRAITRFDAAEFSVRIGGEVRDFDAAAHIPAKLVRQTDVFVHYGLVAGMQAIADAGLSDNEPDAERIGVSIGSGIGGLSMIENVQDLYRKSGPRRISPFFVPGTIVNIISGHLSILNNFLGPNMALVSACTTGAHNIGEGLRLIQYGDAEVMICGGAEAAITPLGLGSFASARALSASFNDAPEKASRPFDSGRDGFVLSEGAGVLVLEEYERARARGANIYCLLSGYGMSADGYHITAPLEDGKGAARAMTNAMNDAGVAADEVDYVNAHGTSTPLGDVAETRAIHLALTSAAGSTAVSSTKSMTGHLLGAAGGVEAIFTVLAMRDGIMPPTINIDNPDPDCDLDYVPNTAREKSIRAALSNSFGFGGTNATLVFQRA
ncbi:MAG: beta-ketoacyl-ACP synthase II [Gammaproteobacteria bacterium]